MLTRSRGWTRLALLAALLLASVRARADVACPAGPINFTEGIYRGFYVSGLGGGTLGTVTLRYYPVGPYGAYTVTLTARADTYDGALIGTPQSQTFFPPIPQLGAVTVTFDFGHAAVPPGATVTFTQTLDAGPLGGSLNLDAGPCTAGDAACNLCPGFFETADTTPPLSTFRRRSVAATITGAGGAAAAAVPALGPLARIVAILALAAAAWWVRRS